jgi:5-methylcytosine-specific restriction protein A
MRGGLEAMQEPPSFELGKVYSRARDLHEPYGGGRQSGISTPKDQPFIFLFTGESGEQHGYEDGWDADGVFLYSGEGQLGDMQFVRGNRAIRDHATDGKDLLLFQSLGKGLGVRYLGSFACAGWLNGSGVDRDGQLRQVIVFQLVPQENATEPELVGPSSRSLDALRVAAYQAATPSSAATSGGAKRSYYERSQAVRQYVLARAAGICESCGKPAPFSRPDGTLYLEPDHIRRVSDGGPDHPRWVAGICRNCHREIHFGSAGPERNEALAVYLEQIERVAGGTLRAYG